MPAAPRHPVVTKHSSPARPDPARPTAIRRETACPQFLWITLWAAYSEPRAHAVAAGFRKDCAAVTGGATAPRPQVSFGALLSEVAPTSEDCVKATNYTAAALTKRILTLRDRGAAGFVPLRRPQRLGGKAPVTGSGHNAGSGSRTGAARRFLSTPAPGHVIRAHQYRPATATRPRPRKQRGLSTEPAPVAATLPGAAVVRRPEELMCRSHRRRPW